MNHQKRSIDELDEIYHKSCSLAGEIADNDDSKIDADIRLGLMFIKYAKTHNQGGKFDQVYDEDALVVECEKYLIYAGNSAYFDYRLTAYRNNMDLLNMLRDALQLLKVYQDEIFFRKQDGTFIDKIHDGHIADVERLDKEVETLISELDTKQVVLSKFGFFSKRTVRKNDYIRLEKEAGELKDRKEQVAAELAALENEYAQYHDDYYRYMQNLSTDSDSKISRYFFSEYDEEFEQIYGMSNQFKADHGWLEEKIEMVINIIGADQDTYQQLQDMLTEAKTHSID